MRNNDRAETDESETAEGKPDWTSLFFRPLRSFPCPAFSLRHRLRCLLAGERLKGCLGHLAGTFTDPGLRTHELFKPDAKAIGRRSLRYNAVAALLAVSLIGGGVAWRSTHGSQEPLVDAVLAKVPYWRELVRKVSY